MAKILRTNVEKNCPEFKKDLMSFTQIMRETLTSRLVMSSNHIATVKLKFNEE